MHIRNRAPYTVGDPPTPVPLGRISERFGPGDDGVQDGGPLQKLGVLAGEDVVGDGGDLELLA
jgi:hypothetical protein